MHIQSSYIILKHTLQSSRGEFSDCIDLFAQETAMFPLALWLRLHLCLEPYLLQLDSHLWNHVPLGFQLLQNLAALAWSWKAMLKYTQPYYMPPAAETIFWIWVSAANDTVTHCSKKCTLLDIRFSIVQLPNSAQLGPKRRFYWGVPNIPMLRFFAQLQKLALHTTKP